MPLVRGWRQACRFAGRAVTAYLLVLGSAVGANAQDSSSGEGDVERVVAIVEADDASAAAPEGSDDGEMLFADGPREPDVLSAEGTLIRGGVKNPQEIPQARAEGDAVAALVATLGAGASAQDSSGEGGLEEIEETGVEESRESAPSLLERIGGLLGVGSD